MLTLSLPLYISGMHKRLFPQTDVASKIMEAFNEAFNRPPFLTRGLQPGGKHFTVQHYISVSHKPCNCFPASESKFRANFYWESSSGVSRSVDQADEELDSRAGQQNSDNRATPAAARKCKRKGRRNGAIFDWFPRSKKTPFLLTPSGTAT